MHGAERRARDSGHDSGGRTSSSFIISRVHDASICARRISSSSAWICGGQSAASGTALVRMAHTASTRDLYSGWFCTHTSSSSSRMMAPAARRGARIKRSAAEAPDGGTQARC